MAALFRKKKNETTIAELEEYYANQQKGRSAKAWFMALLSLLITVAVIVGLFYAGRWIYQTVTGSDSNETTTTDSSSGEDVNLPTYDSDSAGEVGVSFEEGSSNNPDDLVMVDNSQPTQDYPSVVDDGAAVTTESNVDRVASGSTSDSQNQNDGSQSAVGGESTTNTAESGKTSATVPDTGPGETAAVIIFATGIAGYIASRKYYANK